MISNRFIEKDKARNYDIVVGGALFLIIVISKANILTLPFHWDEMAAYIIPTHWLAEGSLFRVIPGHYPASLFFGHPPGLYLSVALLFKIFSGKIWIAHSFVICFSFLGVYFTYLLAGHLFDRKIGLLSSLLLFLSPLYFAQSGMVHADIIVASLGVMCVYFALKGRFVAYLLCGLYLVMIKESAAAIIAAIMCYFYLTEKNDPKIGRKVLKYSIPLLVLFIFFLWQKITTGQFLPNPYFESNHFFIITIRPIGWTFVNQGRIVVTVLILLSLVINRDAWKRKEIVLFLLILLSVTGTYSFIYFMARYILPVLPFFFIAGAYAIVELLRDWKLQALSTAVIAMISIGLHGGTQKGSGNFDEDMQYVDVVLNHKEMCRYIEETFPGKVVLAAWPITDALANPYLGYVKTPVALADLNEPSDVVAYTEQGPHNEKIKTSARRQNLKLVKTFEKNGKYAEVYIKDSPDN